MAGRERGNGGNFWDSRFNDLRGEFQGGWEDSLEGDDESFFSGPIAPLERRQEQDLRGELLSQRELDPIPSRPENFAILAGKLLDLEEIRTSTSPRDISPENCKELVIDMAFFLRENFSDVLEWVFHYRLPEPRGNGPCGKISYLLGGLSVAISNAAKLEEKILSTQAIENLLETFCDKMPQPDAPFYPSLIGTIFMVLKESAFCKLLDHKFSYNAVVRLGHLVHVINERELGDVGVIGEIYSCLGKLLRAGLIDPGQQFLVAEKLSVSLRAVGCAIADNRFKKAAAVLCALGNAQHYRALRGRIDLNDVNVIVKVFDVKGFRSLTKERQNGAKIGLRELIRARPGDLASLDVSAINAIFGENFITECQKEPERRSARREQGKLKRLQGAYGAKHSSLGNREETWGRERVCQRGSGYRPSLEREDSQEREVRKRRLDQLERAARAAQESLQSIMTEMQQLREREASREREPSHHRGSLPRSPAQDAHSFYRNVRSNRVSPSSHSSATHNRFGQPWSAIESDIERGRRGRQDGSRSERRGRGRDSSWESSPNHD